MSLTINPQWAVIVPFLGALAIGLTGRWPKLRESLTMITALVLLLIVGLIFPQVMAGERPGTFWLSVMPGLDLALEVEPLGMLFAGVAAFLWVVTSIYSITYMYFNRETNLTRYFACFALAIGSAMGVAFAGNLFTLFVFYEVLTLATYPLVTHRGDESAMKGGRVYLGILLTTSIGLQLVAIIWTWAATGTLDFQDGGILEGHISESLVPLLLALYIFGIGKAAVMPFHRWLPSAMVAPAPVSALLHAVAVVKAGVFSVLKIIVYVFGVDFLDASGGGEIMAYFAGATILLASLIALSLDNLKARLAYSTIGQLSYVVLGGLLANQLALMGGALHIAMHAFGKITLFLCAGAIYLGSRQILISKTHGLGWKMPITFVTFFIASLSIIGLPPAGGTWSKWFLALGAVEAELWIFVAVLMISSLLNIWYLLEIPVKAFMKPADSGILEQTREAPLPCLIVLGITSAGCIALFLFLDPLVVLLNQIGGG